jgi:hypothetical protein
MLKTRVGKVTTLAVGCLLAVCLLYLFSEIHFPFMNAKASLNGHLNQDFGKALPSSAMVEESYWVGYRRSEAVFKIQMAAAEAVAFVEELSGIAKSKDRWKTAAMDLRASHPIYRPPAWWNNPPLPDAQAVDIVIFDDTGARCHYLLLYSASTGKLYLVWGGTK